MKKAITILLSVMSVISFAQTIPGYIDSHPSSDFMIYSDTSGTVHSSVRPVLYTMPSITDVKSKKHFINVTPLVYTGLNLNNEVNGNQFSAGAGVRSMYMYKTKLSAYISLMPVTTSFDTVITNGIDSTGIVPHEGSYFSRSGNRFNYLTIRGGLYWKTASWFTLFGGYEKFFIGDGVRSLLWSDNSSPFWQVRATVKTNKISYVMLYSLLKGDDNDVQGIRLQDKYCSAHYLNWNIGKRISLSFFEAVVWRGSDSLAFRGYDVNYINPIIFYRPVEFNLGSPDNVLLGAGGRIRLFGSTHLYGQFILDEFKLSELKAKSGWWANKFGILAGIKSIHKISDEKYLIFQGEISGARPFTYSHSNSLENFGNSMEAIAHPLGANFRDIWFKASYTPSKWTFSLIINQSAYGSDTSASSYNMGHNIYRSYRDSRNEYGNKWLQGIPVKRTMAELKTGWCVNKYWNMTVEGGVRFIMLQTDQSKSKQVQVFAGVVTRF